MGSSKNTMSGETTFAPVQHALVKAEASNSSIDIVKSRFQQSFHGCCIFTMVWTESRDNCSIEHSPRLHVTVH